MLNKKVMATMLTGVMTVTTVAPTMVGQQVVEHTTLLSSNDGNGVTASAQRNVWLKNQMNKVIKKRDLGVAPLDNGVVMNFQNDSGFMPTGKIFLSTNTNLDGVLIKICNAKGDILTQGNLEKHKTTYTTPTGESIQVPYYAFQGIAGTKKYIAQPGNDIDFGLNTCHVEYQSGSGFQTLNNKEGKPITFTQNIIPLTFYTENKEVPNLTVGKEYQYGNGVNILGTVVPFEGPNGVPTVRVCSNFGGTINFYNMGQINQSNPLARFTTSLTDSGISVKTTNPVAENDFYYNPGIIYNTIEANAFNEPSITVEVKTAASKEYPKGQYVDVAGNLNKIDESSKTNPQNVLQQDLKGVPYTNVKIGQPILPKDGYSIVGMTINGKKVKSLPTYFTLGNQNIVYTIAKTTTTINAKYVDTKTNDVVNGGTFTLSEGKASVKDGITSTTVDGTVNITATETKLPDGYRVVG
ncbi:MAG: hypothetical protein ACRCWG_11140, partial [Sarcina sp.]